MNSPGDGSMSIMNLLWGSFAPLKLTSHSSAGILSATLSEYFALNGEWGMHAVSRGENLSMVPFFTYDDAWYNAVVTCLHTGALITHHT